MKPRLLANRNVFPIGLGAMAVDEYKPKSSNEDAMNLFRYAMKQGIEFFDTADVYGLGRNEELLGEAFTSEEKKRILIGTKVGCTRPRGVEWDTDGRAEHIKKAIHDSLRRLQMKQIFLYQLHAPDHRVPLQESITALKELQDSGVVKHLGVSNFNVKQVQEAQKIIEIVSVQNHFNLFHKQDERDLLPYLTKNNIAYIPYFPLGSGRVVQDKRLAEIAQKINATPAQVALAWILTKWPTAIPIPGTKRKEHMDENKNAARIELTEKIIKQLDTLS